MSKNWTFMAKNVVFAIGLSLSIVGFTPAVLAESFVGVGAVIEKKSNGRFQIIQTLDNSPIAAAGVIAGEYVTAVDAQPARGMDLDALVGLIRGPEGTFVTLSLTNERQTSARDVRVVRARMDVPCFLEGNINLSTSIFSGSGSIQGYIGNQSVNLNVFNGRANGYVGNQSVWLDVGIDETYNRILIQGWIRSTYVRWEGVGGYISGYQSCIR